MLKFNARICILDIRIAILFNPYFITISHSCNAQVLRVFSGIAHKPYRSVKAGGDDLRVSSPLYTSICFFFTLFLNSFRELSFAYHNRVMFSGGRAVFITLAYDSFNIIEDQVHYIDSFEVFLSNNIFPSRWLILHTCRALGKISQFCGL
nr:hypothetical transcript [Hymenolepis microstoma]